MATGIHQDTVLATYYDQGNYDDVSQNYIPVVATMDTALDVTYAQISDTTKVWTLDFAVTDGIEWVGGATPSTFDSAQKVVEKFHLKFAPNLNQAGTTDDDGVKSSLTIADAS